MKKRPIIIDTDPGIDDAVAIAIALFDERLDVKLITTVAGNVSVDKTTMNLIKLLTFLGKEVPVARGAERPLVRPSIDASEIHGDSGMDGYEFPEAKEVLLVENHAVVEMFQTLMKQEEAITLVTIGPLTNIGLLLRMYPQCKTKIKEIVMMGGSLGRGNTGVLSEFNFAVDPESAKIVFESGLPLAMAPLDVGLKVAILPEDSEQIKQMGKTGDMIYHLFKNYRSGSFLTGLNMFDSCAMAYLLAPEMYTVVETYVAIETQGEFTSGASVVDLEGYLEQKENCRVCVDIDQKKFKNWFMTALSKCN